MSRILGSSSTTRTVHWSVAMDYGSVLIRARRIGQREGEHRAAPGSGGVRGQGAAVGVCQRAGGGQPDPAALVRGRVPSGNAALEALEDQLEVLGCDSAAGVGYAQHSQAVLVAEADGDPVAALACGQRV